MRLRLKSLVFFYADLILLLKGGSFLRSCHFLIEKQQKLEAFIPPKTRFGACCLTILKDL